VLRSPTRCQQGPRQIQLRHGIRANRATDSEAQSVERSMKKRPNLKIESKQKTSRPETVPIRAG
jgi:hypothetical protein